VRQSLITLHSSAQTRQLYADHRPWTQRRRRRGKPDAPRLDAEGKPKADACSYHVQARRRTRRAPAGTRTRTRDVVPCAKRRGQLGGGHTPPLRNRLASQPAGRPRAVQRHRPADRLSPDSLRGRPRSAGARGRQRGEPGAHAAGAGSRLRHGAAPGRCTVFLVDPRRRGARQQPRPCGPCAPAHALTATRLLTATTPSTALSGSHPPAGCGDIPTTHLPHQKRGGRGSCSRRMS